MEELFGSLNIFNTGTCDYRFQSCPSWSQLGVQVGAPAIIRLVLSRFIDLGHSHVHNPFS